MTSRRLVVALAAFALVTPSGATHYDGTLDLSVSGEKIEASWRIETEVDAGTDSLGLLLSSRQEVLEIRGDRIESYESEPAGMPGIQRLRVDLVEGASGPVVFYARHRGPLFDGPDPERINRITEDWIELGLDSFWHPVFETFDRPFTARLTLKLSEDWELVASGKSTRVGDLVVLDNRVPQIDLAFVASPDLETARLGNSVVYAPDAEAPVVDRVLEAAEACAESLNRDFGSREPLPPRRFVLAPREESGYARKNYVVLSRLSDSPEGATIFLCHELAHFWSMRGNPMTVENWLNESFAEYAALRIVRERHGEAAYETMLAEKRERSKSAPPVWTTGSKTRGSHATMYHKGPVALAELEAAIGTEAFDRFLERYMTGTFATTPELLEVLEETVGEEARRTFEDLLAR